MTRTGVSLLDAFGPLPFFLQFGERQGLLYRGFPAGERVGEEDTGAFVAVTGQRGVQFLHRQADLQVGHHEGGWHDLEAEDALGGGLLHLGSGERAEAHTLQVRGDAAQYLGQVCAGAAARVEHEHVFAGQPIWDAEVVLEGFIHAGDHVLHHLGGGVPHAKLLAQVGVECLEEGFVEVGHGVALAELGKESIAVDTVQSRCRPVQRFH